MFGRRRVKNRLMQNGRWIEIVQRPLISPFNRKFVISALRGTAPGSQSGHFLHSHDLALLLTALAAL
jgi:hypothetical protein